VGGLDILLTLTEQLSGEGITLHPQRCLNARFRAVGCTRCADACPVEGAIAIADGKPTLHSEACVYCGLCLHHCPTGAYTHPDTLSDKLIKTVAALPAGPVDLICPQHSSPECGPAPQAVQVKRCLAALSPAGLLELATQGREIWMDDTYCTGCPLGKVHPALEQTVADANGWASLLDDVVPVRLRTRQSEPVSPVDRPVHEADRPPVSRRSLFGSFKKTGQEQAAAKEPAEMVTSGKSVPVSERLPQLLPYQRVKFLQILEQNSLNPQVPAFTTPPTVTLPIVDVSVDRARCTACGLCARFCPSGALKYMSVDDQFALVFQPNLCLGQACDICVLACPEQAVVTEPAAVSSALLAKKPLVAGDLMKCPKCGEPIAKGPVLPTTCFACRPQNKAADLFASFQPAKEKLIPDKSIIPDSPLHRSHKPSLI
jgi:ferredoxin